MVMEKKPTDFLKTEHHIYASENIHTKTQHISYRKIRSTQTGMQPTHVSLATFSKSSQLAFFSFRNKRLGPYD